MNTNDLTKQAPTSAPAAPQEDAQSTTSEHRWRCACGWVGTPSQMTVSNDLRTCPRCGTSGGLILDATLTPQQTCEHGIAWSMECLSCGHSDYVAAAPTPSQPARDAAREIADLQYSPAWNRDSKIEEFAAIISRHLPAPAETVGEAKNGRGWCEDCGSKNIIIVRQFATAEEFLDAYNAAATNDSSDSTST